jgi:hypothetical protein
VYVVPVTSPNVLTEDIFGAYGGHTGTASSTQLNAAFCIGEQRAQQEICTPLVPTQITGSAGSYRVNLLAYGQPFTLPHTHLRSVDEVHLVCEKGCTDCTVSTHEVCAHIKNFMHSVVELRLVCTTTCGTCCSVCGSPLNFTLYYTAGLAPGLAASVPSILHALTVAADIALEQIVDPGASEGGPGDPGVQRWGSLTYREDRTRLRHTAFGSSARANYAANLLQPWKSRRALKLGW